MSKALVLLLLAGFVAGVVCRGPVQLSAGVGAAWGLSTSLFCAVIIAVGFFLFSLPMLLR